MEQRFDWEDLDYTAIAEANECAVTWRVLEIIGWSVEEPRRLIGWWKEGEDAPEPCTENPAEAATVLRLYVKWDGCSELSLPGERSVHTCDWGEALTSLISRMFEMSPGLMRSAKAG